MGSAASLSSLRDHSQDEVIGRCAVLYANDPMFFEYVVAEAKKKALSDRIADNAGEYKAPAEDAVSVAASQEYKDDQFEPASAEVSLTNGAGNSIDLLSVINRVRMQPSGFISELEKHMEKFVDDTVFQLKIEGKTINVRTIEGKAAVLDGIEFLKTCPSVDPIKYSPLLEKAALDHVRDIYSNSVSGHEVRLGSLSVQIAVCHNHFFPQGSDGSSMVSRVERYAAWSGSIAENIDMGNSDATDIVIALIVDDGVPTRGHRNNIFDPSLHYGGSALGPHPEYDNVCVIDFAGDVKDIATIFQKDILITCKGGTEMSTEFEKVLYSIPMQQVHDDVKREIANGHEVEIEYSYSLKSAEVRFITKSSKRTMKLKWGPSRGGGAAPA